MIPTLAVIPTRFHPPELTRLLALLSLDAIRAIVLQSEQYEHRIYRMWNEGTALARAQHPGPLNVAVLNDDITILPGTLAFLAAALRAEPDLGVTYPDVRAPLAAGLPATVTVERTEGTWGPGGMTGFCFVFRAEAGLPAFDEGYRWWYGDDAFEAGVRAAGFGVGRVRGVPIEHRPDGSASRVWSEFAPLVAADRARWAARA